MIAAIFEVRARAWNRLIMFNSVSLSKSYSICTLIDKSWRRIHIGTWPRTLYSWLRGWRFKSLIHYKSLNKYFTSISFSILWSVVSVSMLYLLVHTFLLAEKPFFPVESSLYIFNFNLLYTFANSRNSGFYLNRFSLFLLCSNSILWAFFALKNESMPKLFFWAIYNTESIDLLQYFLLLEMAVERELESDVRLRFIFFKSLNILKFIALLLVELRSWVPMRVL